MAGSNVITFDGCIKDINQLILADATTWRIALFTNNRILTQADTPADFTEPTFTGYSQQAISGWNPAAYFGGTDVHNTATAYNTWQPTASTSLPQTVYGIYITDGGTDLLAVEKFGASFDFVDSGSILRYLPRIYAGLLPP
jgi:hypothetical protein